MVLATGAHLFHRPLATKVPLPRFAVRDLACSGYLETLRHTFVRLVHRDREIREKRKKQQISPTQASQMPFLDSVVDE